MVNKVAREKAVGWLRRKMKTGRPASASSCESVSKGERKEERLMIYIYIKTFKPFSPNEKYLDLLTFSPEDVSDFDQVISRGVTHIIIGPVAGSHLKSK